MLLLRLARPASVEECQQRLLLESTEYGLKDAAMRSRRCAHDCRYVSLRVGLPGKVSYGTLLRRCAYAWFSLEYPPEAGITHDTFFYPV